ncbi:MAG: sulfatase, partial [Planctomycetota bacterium]
MNVIVVVIDTLRYDHVGANGNESISTPNLDRLAAESWCFDRCFVTSFPTIPHRLDVITGRSGSPFHPWAPLPHDVPTLPRAFADAGYCTQLIHDTPHLVNGGHNFDWPFHAWTFVRGAEVDRPLVGAPLDLSAPSKDWPGNWARDPLFDFAGDDPKLWQGTSTYVWANRGRKDDEDWNAAKLFKTAARWLEDNAARERFFLWVDCFDPHEPWDAPPPFVLKYDSTPGYDGRVDPRSFALRNHADLSEDAARRVKALYSAKVSWMDRWLGDFLDAFEQSGLSENSALILTADHGTDLRERGKFGKGTPVREGEGHVPLFIRVPGGEHGRSSAFVQPQDIFGTVAALALVETPGGVESQDVLAVAREGSSGA